MLSTDEARARVAKGAAHLDRVRPGWAERIDVGTLTLHDPCGCIVGQLCRGSNFFEGREALGMTREAVSEMGMNIDHRDRVANDMTKSSREAYQPLQDAWIEAIAARLHPAEAHAPVAVTVEG